MSLCLKIYQLNSYQLLDSKLEVDKGLDGGTLGLNHDEDGGGKKDGRQDNATTEDDALEKTLG